MSTKKSAFFALAVFLLAANLRAAIIVVGPLVDDIAHAINANPADMGFIVGSLPMLAFALCSPFAARLARRFGLENTILAGLGLIALGTAIRALWITRAGLMLGTFILCSGIALGNVLLAAAIRRNDTRLIERMTAIQMIAFSVFASVAAAFAIPLAKWLTWQGAISIWALLLIPTALVWWQIRAQHHSPRPLNPETHAAIPIWRSALAWKISLYTGIQSMLYYTLVVWLPSFIHSRGFTMEVAGQLSMIFQLMCLPAVMLLAPLVERYPRFDHLMMGSAGLILAGLMGMWYWPAHLIWLPLAIIGIGSACSFTLSLMLFALRGQNFAQAAALSGMAQAVGYSVAGIGPVLAGWLLQYGQGFRLPMFFMFFSAGVLIVLGHAAGRNQALIR